VGDRLDDELRQIEQEIVERRVPADVAETVLALVRRIRQAEYRLEKERAHHQAEIEDYVAQLNEAWGTQEPATAGDNPKEEL